MRILALLAALASCAAYHRHPVATVASVATLSVAPVGITCAIGYCGGGTADTWQGEFARDGGGQISMLALITAATVLAYITDEAEAK